MKLGFRRMTLLMGVLALVAAGCGEDTPPADDGGTPAGEETVCSTYDATRETCTRRYAPTRRSGSRRIPPPYRRIGAEPETGEDEGFDIESRQRSPPPRFAVVVGGHRFGRSSGGEAGTTLGHERRIHEARQRAADV